jgi:hypothetical protein
VKGIDKPIDQTTHVEKAQAVGGIIEEQLALTQVGESIHGLSQLLALVHRGQELIMYRLGNFHFTLSLQYAKIALSLEKNKFSTGFLPERLQFFGFCKRQFPNVAEQLN